MERKERIRPTPVEVLSKWGLLDIVEQTSAVGPVEAFRLFMDYAERALDHDFERELKSALHFDACHTGKIRPDKDGHHLATPEIQEGIAQEVSTALGKRLAPLLPAIGAYVNRRPNDPATVNRLAWMAGKVEAIPGAIEGKVLWRSREQPEGYYMPRKFEPMAWKELHDGLLALLEETSTPNAAPAQPSATSVANRPPFTWKGTPGELFALFEELVGKGWVEVPKNRGKRSRDQLARNVHGAFQFSAGTALQVGTAVNYLKKGRDGVNEQRPEPRVAFALKRNPDVGENYDPDKAGE